MKRAVQPVGLKIIMQRHASGFSHRFPETLKWIQDQLLAGALGCMWNGKLDFNSAFTSLHYFQKVLVSSTIVLRHVQLEKYLLVDVNNLIVHTND